jgi:hypothetical protein
VVAFLVSVLAVTVARRQLDLTGIPVLALVGAGRAVQLDFLRWPDVPEVPVPQVL